MDLIAEIQHLLSSKTFLSIKKRGEYLLVQINPLNLHDTIYYLIIEQTLYDMFLRHHYDQT
jgi:hypothetical protein